MSIAVALFHDFCLFIRYIDPYTSVLICTSLPTPDNGRIIYSIDSTSLYEFGTVATYVCDSGFGLSGGVISSTCGGDDSDPVGTWSGTAPSCLCEL